MGLGQVSEPPSGSNGMVERVALDPEAPLEVLCDECEQRAHCSE